MTYYNRKSPRIQNYDYSNPNYYFITICTHNKKCSFGSVERLNQAGKIAFTHIEQLSQHFEGVRIDKFVVMPNHVHMILILENTEEKISLNQIVAQYKSGVTREVRKLLPEIELWQRSFHDHIIRNQQQYEKIWMYIETNPQKWKDDCFYI